MRTLRTVAPFLLVALMGVAMVLAGGAVVSAGFGGTAVAILLGAAALGVVVLPTAGSRLPQAALRLLLAALAVAVLVGLAMLVARILLGDSPEVESPAIVVPLAAALGGVALLATRLVRKRRTEEEEGAGTDRREVA